MQLHSESRRVVSETSPSLAEWFWIGVQRCSTSCWGDMMPMVVLSRTRIHYSFIHLGDARRVEWQLNRLRWCPVVPCIPTCACTKSIKIRGFFRNVWTVFEIRSEDCVSEPQCVLHQDFSFAFSGSPPGPSEDPCFKSLSALLYKYGHECYKRSRRYLAVDQDPGDEGLAPQKKQPMLAWTLGVWG